MGKRSTFSNPTAQNDSHAFFPSPSFSDEICGPRSSCLQLKATFFSPQLLSKRIMPERQQGKIVTVDRSPMAYEVQEEAREAAKSLNLHFYSPLFFLGGERVGRGIHLKSLTFGEPHAPSVKKETTMNDDSFYLFFPPSAIHLPFPEKKRGGSDNNFIFFENRALWENWVRMISRGLSK